MPFDLAAHLREGMRTVQWHVSDLWVASVGIGAYMGNSDVEAITSGRQRPSAIEYDVLASALNERLAEMGEDHPIRYWSDLPAT
jgi:hypothetical protein